jgi:hypothetical protein
MNNIRKKGIKFQFKKLLSLLNHNSDDHQKLLNHIMTQFMEGSLFHHFEKKNFGFLDFFFGNEIDVFNVQKVENLASEYNVYVEELSNEFPILYSEEKIFTQTQIFHKLAFPIDIVKYLFPFYGDFTGFQINKMIAQSGLELLEKISKLNFKPYISLKFMKYFNDIFMNFRIHLSAMDFDESLSKLKYLLLGRQEIPKDLKLILNSKINQLIALLKIKKRTLVAVYNNPTELGRNILRVINYIQSHMEYFCKYIRKLIHLKVEKNREYENLYYEEHGKKYKDFDYDEFRNICELELKNYEGLKNYLKSIVTQMKKLRNINAHQIPCEFKIIPEKNKIIFPVIGNNEEELINYQYIKSKILKYTALISLIHLHPDDPNKSIENYFLSLE